ncbi:MAG: hypothetical protein LBG83_07000 [Oscillospiraceae bacterium]|jgi:hypothetical protein|nr:hypothetical protein [Oscillospiraceae bacterium]
MTQYSILGRLRLMTQLDDEQAMAALPLCAAAMEQLLARLKPGANRGDPRLDQAGAAAALCMLLLREENTSADEGFSSFKAGDITVTKKEKANAARMAAAEQLRAQALEDARELLRDTGFFSGSTKFSRCGGKS